MSSADDGGQAAPDPDAVIDVVATVGALDPTVLLLREFLHRSGAIRAVAEVLEGVLRSLEPAIGEAGATVVVEGALPVVSADGVQLGQLLQNLVANAVKFHAPGAANRVTVRARRDADDGAWLLSVSDDGIGIGPRQQERIFQIFQRLHPRQDYDGTGIGLAICRRIAERLGGAITVESAPGEGSTFTVSIPDVRGSSL